MPLLFDLPCAIGVEEDVLCDLLSAASSLQGEVLEGAPDKKRNEANRANRRKGLRKAIVQRDGERRRVWRKIAVSWYHLRRPRHRRRIRFIWEISSRGLTAEAPGP